MQTRGVDEGQAAQIEHQAPGALDAIQRGAQRLDGGEVELAAGLHDRDIVAPLHVDGERLRAGDLDRPSDPVRCRPSDDARLVCMPVSLATRDPALRVAKLIRTPSSRMSRASFEARITIR